MGLFSASSRSSLLTAGLVALGVASGSFGCSKSLSLGKSGKNGNQRPVAIVHEECNTGSSSAQKVDANADGKPEIVTVMAGGRMECQAMDLDFDGNFDRHNYYDQTGQLRRVESDYDRDGRIDEIALYQNGALFEKHREMNLDGKLDTWLIYEGGQPTRQERDTDGDGKVDEWWQFTGQSGPNGPRCAIVAKDIDGDGNPEPSSQVDTCKSGDENLPAGTLPTYTAPPSGSAPPPPPPPAAASSAAPASSAPRP